MANYSKVSTFAIIISSIAVIISAVGLIFSPAMSRGLSVSIFCSMIAVLCANIAIAQSLKKKK